MTGQADRLTLHHPPFRVDLSPAAGGLIEQIHFADAERSLDLLHRPAQARPSRVDVNRFGCWPLVPFANRAFGAVVRSGARSIVLPVNDPDTGSAIHGFGWQSVWTPVETDADRVVLEHARTDGPDPYRYQSTLTVALTEAAVTITLAVTNRAAETLPCGIGLHPWWAATPGATGLRTRTGGALMLGEGYRPTGHQTFTQGGPFADAPLIDPTVETAWSLTGWDGEAILTDTARDLRLRLTASPSLSAPVIWAPPGAPFLCIEPQSHAIGAPSEPVAAAHTPLAALAAGETLSGWIRVEVLR